MIIKFLKCRFTRLAGLQNNAALTNAMVPIFSASRAKYGDAGQRVTFRRLEIDTCEIHGSFDKRTGVFRAKTTGVYLIQFNGVIADSYTVEVNLRVNGAANADSYCFHPSAKERFQSPIVISSLVKLCSGDSVDVFVKHGNIVESSDNDDGDDGSLSRFSAILFSYWNATDFVVI